MGEITKTLAVLGGCAAPSPKWAPAVRVAFHGLMACFCALDPAVWMTAPFGKKQLCKKLEQKKKKNKRSVLPVKFL